MQVYFKGEKKYVMKVKELIKQATDIAMSSASCEIAAPTSDASSPGAGSSLDVIPIVASSSTVVVVSLPVAQEVTVAKMS